MPLDCGVGRFLGNAQPSEGGHISLVTQYVSFLPPAFCRISSAVMTVAPDASLKAIPEQYTPTRNPADSTASAQAWRYPRCSGRSLPPSSWSTKMIVRGGNPSRRTDVTASAASELPSLVASPAALI